MSNGYKGEGAKFNYTATGAVTEGSVIQFEDMCGVALNSGATGDTIPVAICGEFTLAKTAASDTGFTQGDKVYITSAGVINNTASGDKLVGYASSVAATGATAVDVIIAQ